jgi:hypothetical protein
MKPSGVNSHRTIEDPFNRLKSLPYRESYEDGTHAVRKNYASDELRL